MPEFISLEELWLKCRGVENSFRYYSDVIAAVGKDLKSRGLLSSGIPVSDPAVQAALELAFPTGDDEPLPKVPPIRCPPWCRVVAGDAIEGLGRVGRIADAVTKVGSALMVIRAHSPGGGEALHVYVSELPGTHWGHMREHGEGDSHTR